MIFKVAKLPAWEVARRIGTGALIGAGVGAGARYRNDKFRGKKSKTKHLVQAGLAGGAVGGLYGFSSNFYNNKHTPQQRQRLSNWAEAQGFHGVGNQPVVGTVAGGLAGGLYGTAAQMKANSETSNKREQNDPLATGLLVGGLGMMGGHRLGQVLQEDRLRHLGNMRHGRTQSKWDERRWKRDSAASQARWRERRRESDDFWSNFDPFGTRERARAGGGYSGRSSSHASARASVPEWLSGVTTKVEAKSRFRAQARKHHPDLGGSAERMKAVNGEWADFEKHHFDKLAYLRFRSFVDESLKIAGAA